MLHYTNCAGCGARCQPFGFQSIGFVCASCATHAVCHDCNRLFHKTLLTDHGDGYLSCEGCQVEVGARRQMALRQEAGL